jgi:hypothetical protein
MSISTRRKVGILLVAVSVAAQVAFLVVGIFRGAWRHDGSGSSGNVHWMLYSVELNVSAYYLIPIFLCGAIGGICLLWPSRRPPKLNL